MNKEEIDYWLKVFSKNPIHFRSGEDKEISFVKVFMVLKKLQQEKEKLREQLKQATKNYEREVYRVEILTRQLKLVRENDDFTCKICRKLFAQQKEFIKYLEDKINRISEQIKNYDIWHEVGTDINFLILKKQFYIEILQNYKKIIGDKTN